MNKRQRKKLCKKQPRLGDHLVKWAKLMTEDSAEGEMARGCFKAMEEAIDKEIIDGLITYEKRGSDAT